VNLLDIGYIAAAAWIAAALTGLLAGRTKPGLLACCALSGIGGAAAVAGGGWSLVYGDTPVVTPGGAAATIVGGPLELQMTPLAGVFVALLGIVTVAIALYAPRYHEPGRGTAVYLAAYNLALLACLAVLAAGGMVTFLVAWETMSLTCYLLILRRVRRDDVARGAFWFLALSEIGFLLVVAAFVILASKTHATGLDAIADRAHLVPTVGAPPRTCSPSSVSGSRPGLSRFTSGCPRRTPWPPRTGPRSCPAWSSSSASTASPCSRSGWLPPAAHGPVWSRWASAR
jgi:formate hydrogenlyase subunit 3/multisubunit Na+/H+ antiporter MnhD subunit